MSCISTDLHLSPQVFDEIKVLRLWRPFQNVDLRLIQPFSHHFIFVLGSLSWWKHHLRSIASPSFRTSSLKLILFVNNSLICLISRNICVFFLVYKYIVESRCKFHYPAINIFLIMVKNVLLTWGHEYFLQALHTAGKFLKRIKGVTQISRHNILLNSLQDK